MTADILVVGDVMTDVIVRPRGPLVRGSDRTATIRQAPGGSGANQAAWIGHLGGHVSFAGRVGAADHAAQVTALRGCGVQPLLAADPDLPTGLLVTLLDPDGERSFLTDRGANTALNRSDLPDSLLDGVRLLHVSGYSLFTEAPRAAVLGLVAAALRRGIPWTVDAASAGFIDDVGPRNFSLWIGTADTLFANGLEAATLAGTGDRAMQFTALGAPARTVVIKRGAEGALASGPHHAMCEIPAPTVTPVDTTGAGDAFLAAFLLARLAGQTLPACLAAGVRQGSQAATRLGGRPG
jgi:sugar/nucleoside kinase (ribokinase family)